MADKSNWHVLEYFTPIKENSLVNDDFMIKGTAISETTTHNNHKYIAEELQKAVTSLVNKPLLVDHDNRVESIKGLVTNAFWNENTRSIEFEAKVMDKTIREMIKDGRVNKVSIGAFAEDLIKEESGAIIAKGIKIAELSLVAVPADDNATFANAMANNFSLKESLQEMDMEKEKCKECNKMIPKDKMKEHMKSHTSESAHIYTIERRYGEMTEENKVLQESDSKYLEENKKLLEEVMALRNEKKQRLIEEYKKLCADKKVSAKEVSNLSEDTIKLLMEQVSEIKMEEKREMKSLVVKEELKDAENFMFERSNDGYAIWEMPNSDQIRRLHSNFSTYKPQIND